MALRNVGRYMIIVSIYCPDGPQEARGQVDTCGGVPLPEQDGGSVGTGVEGGGAHKGREGASEV